MCRRRRDAVRQRKERTKALSGRHALTSAKGAVQFDVRKARSDKKELRLVEEGLIHCHSRKALLRRI